jgi:NADPH-dependent 2,4-dienoyl-CoA reductase/sulfur reductase-like enzyme
VQTPAGGEELIHYDALVIVMGATSVRPPISGFYGPDALGPDDGVHLLHSMGDTFAVMRTLIETSPSTALIIGAGYIGPEMAEALIARGLTVTQVEMQVEVLPTIDPQLGALVHAELETHGVEVITGTTVDEISYAQAAAGRLRVDGHNSAGPISRVVDMVLVVSGVRPDTALAQSTRALRALRAS